jgi:hypothetical protein
MKTTYRIVIALLVAASFAVVVHDISAQSRRHGATTIGGPRVPPAIPAPNLSECPPLGRKIAREKYMTELRKDTATIRAELLATTNLYQSCHLLSGSYRNACCKKIQDTSIQKCQDKIKAQEAAENPCAPRPVDCRLLRPAKCLLERSIERKRIECCRSIDDQVLGLLLSACVSSASAAATGCAVPEETATPVADVDVTPGMDIGISPTPDVQVTYMPNTYIPDLPSTALPEDRPTPNP